MEKLTKIYLVNDKTMLIGSIRHGKEVYYVQPLKGHHGRHLSHDWKETLAAANISLGSLPDPIDNLYPGQK